MGSGRGAPAFSPDQARLPEGPPGAGAEKQASRAWKVGEALGEAGVVSGWSAEGLGWAPMEGRSAPCAGPCPGPQTGAFPPNNHVPTPHPHPLGQLGAPAPQTLRESRPGQPGHSLQGTLINQTSLPNGHSPATGSGSPSVRSLGARRPVPHQASHHPIAPGLGLLPPSLSPPQAWTQTSAGVTQAPQAGSLSLPGLKSRHQSPRQQVLCEKSKIGDFPGSPVVRVPGFQASSAGGEGSIPGQRTKISNAEAKKNHTVNSVHNTVWSLHPGFCTAASLPFLQGTPTHPQKLLISL